MNIIYLSSSEFGLPALKALIEECFQISCVVTQPDRPSGRKLERRPNCIKEAAVKAGLPVFQPGDINALQSVEHLAGLNPDVLVVVSYGQILSSRLLSLPKIIPVNIHGSLLPAYRGPAPVNWAIVNGDSTTGVTLMKIEPKLDSGPVILKKSIPITEEDDALTLEKRLALEGAQLLVAGLFQVQSGEFPLVAQDETKVTWARKLTKDDGLIDWREPAPKVANSIRGLAGWPGSYSYLNDKLIKILEARPAGENGDIPGTIVRVSKDTMIVACGAGSLEIYRLQPEAKRAMNAQEFMSGHRVAAGDRFGSAVPGKTVA